MNEPEFSTRQKQEKKGAKVNKMMGSVQPTQRQTEISTAMEKLSRVNSILREKIELLSQRLSAVMQPKPKTACADPKEKKNYCTLASAIISEAEQIAVSCSIIDAIIEDLEL